MKKTLCFMLALMLTLGLTTAALASAQTSAPQAAETLSPDEAAEDASFSEGEDGAADQGQTTPNVASTRTADGAVTIDGQYTIFCPAALEEMDVDQQDLADGLLFSAYSDTMGMDIYKYPQEEDTLQTLYDSYKADGDMTEVTLADVGGVQVLVYRIDETGIDVTLAGDTGSFYDIMISYQTDEEYAQVGQMVASIKKIG